ncbi:MAG: DUF4468 domain-containing protein [Bacteroidales bacterium]|nr:DUF4468 domain-containing protein [Bacteroidales bacterium]
MKKTLFIALIMCIAVAGFAQKKTIPPVPNVPMDDETGLITYKEVIQENGTAKELYDRALVWAKSYYKNTGEIIKSADAEKCEIKFRGSVRIYSRLDDGKKITKNVVYYNFTLQCREGRYRYTITDFNEKAQSAAPIERWLDTDAPKWIPDYYLYLQDVDDGINELIASLLEGMQPVQKVEDDW